MLKQFYQNIKSPLTTVLLVIGMIIASLPGIAIVAFYVIFWIALDDTMQKAYQMNVPRIPAIYKKAGFKGKVTHMNNESGMHSQRISYTYVEGKGKDKLTYHFYFGIDKTKQVPKYSLDDIVDLHFQLMESRYDSINKSLFDPFFDQALTNTKAQADYLKTVKVTFNTAHFQNTRVKLYDTYDDHKREPDTLNIATEVKKDLHEFNKNGYQPIYGINKLDSLKYLMLQETIVVTIDNSPDEFHQHINDINTTSLLPGYYDIYFDKAQKYSKYELTEDKQWVNIIDSITP